VEYGYWLTWCAVVGRRQETVAIGAAAVVAVVVVCGPDGVLCEFGQGEENDRRFF
jgi:hypothetical protein